jgi:hypothetical protein
MADSKTFVKQKRKRMGRPVTVGGENFVGMRLPSALLEAVDKWGEANEVQRSEAIRRLLELGLTVKQRRAKGKAD